jgi:hypothetical protein
MRCCSDTNRYRETGAHSLKIEQTELREQHNADHPLSEKERRSNEVIQDSAHGESIAPRAVTGRRPVATLPRMDAAGIPALQDAIRHLHGLEATWLESVPVHEQHEGQTVWEGEVQVFAVEHPKALRVYAWSHEAEGGRRRFHAVLGAGPVDRAVMAVRTAVLTDNQR